MATKKTLYEVLQVARNASPEVIKSAFETRMGALAGNAAPEVLAERTLLQDAYAILSDPVRRKLYDDKMREQALRAAGSGGDALASKRSTVFAASADSDDTAQSTPLGWMVGIAVLGAVVIGGTWTYFNNTQAKEALRIEEMRRAEQARLAEEAALRQREQAEWAKAQAEKRQDEAEWRRQEQERRRDAMYLQQQSRQQQMDARQRAQEEQRAKYEQQRAEQESLRRSQMELERQRRYLQELERSRNMNFGTR
jgi:predicted ribosomally synthesized peptide with SipW-like signal peptide